MITYFAETALLPHGWARDVRIDVDAAGDIVEVETEAARDGAQPVVGPVVPGMASAQGDPLLRALAGLGERVEGPGSNANGPMWLGKARRMLDRLTPADVEAVAAQTFLDMLQLGYTTVGICLALPKEDAGDHAHALIRAAERVGMEATLLPMLGPGAGETEVDALLALTVALAAEFRDRRTLRLGVAAAALPEVAPEVLAALVAGAQTLDPMTPIHLPLARTATEIAACQTQFRARPVEWLLAHAPVDGRWCLHHAAEMTPEEARALAASDAVVGLSPSTEANLAYGAFDLSSYFAADGQIAIGAGIGTCLDPFEELRWLEYGQRQRRGRRTVGARSSASCGASLYLAALEGGAQALGRPVGRIAPGYRADLLVLDNADPPLFGRRDDLLLDTLIFAGAGAGAIRDVMVGGSWVILDGFHPLRDSVASSCRHALMRLRG